MSTTIAAIGECMLELSRSNDSPVNEISSPTNLAFGGDSLNTCIYLARLGVTPSYVTALGDDPLSLWMAECWQQEGIDCSQVHHVPGELPGLYFIETDNDGERSFHYWRDRAPVKRLLDDPSDAARVLEALNAVPMIYLSGITLAVLTQTSRERLLTWLPEYRKSGGRVAFDNNYRPRLWKSPEEARNAFEMMYGMTDLALPTLEDQIALFGEMSADEVIRDLVSRGVGEIALKQGADGSRVAGDGFIQHVPAVATNVVDTTSAGDSFNAGYLASRARGMSQEDAAVVGSNLAAIVIQHRGAIIPKAITDSVAAMIPR